MNRREFLQSLSLISAATGLSGAAYPVLTQNGPHQRSKYLVLVEFKGGNDGLNTVVPHRDPKYRKLRPSLALSSDDVLPIGDSFGLHPKLQTLKTLLDMGRVAIVQGVGYEQPNFSHFSSIDIWESASHRGGDGWMYQLFASNPSMTGIVDSIVFGGSTGFFRGANAKFLVMNSIGEFIRGSAELKLGDSKGRKMHALIAHLQHNKRTILRTSKVLQLQLAKAKSIDIAFPETQIGKQFRHAAEVINAGFDTPVIKLSLPGFDTHVEQRDAHAQLLSEFDNALNAFNQTLNKHDLWTGVLLMTYSEFGRRAKENGNLGTDHGSASCNFVIGPSCRGGLYGVPPRLDQLDNDNLLHQLDFRQLYSTLENQWFEGESSIIDKRKYPPINFLKQS